MSTKTRHIFVAVIIAFAAIFMVAVIVVFARTSAELSAATSVSAIVNDVLATRSTALLAQSDIPYGNDDVINILVLGIDSRKEGKEQHCDAIHMVSLNVRTWTMTIASVPRGTYAPLPPGKVYAPNEYYLANACGYGGLDYGISQIEHVIGITHDYVMTIGFSQALGVFRALKLPTTDTLEWLRHRQGYAIGDPQRSHNQAIFMEDLLRTFGTEKNALSSTMLYVLYHFVDTDMDFTTAHALYRGYVASEQATNATSIVQTMLPYYATVDYHFDAANADTQIAALLERVRPYLSKDDLADRSIDAIQAELLTYLMDALNEPEVAQHIVDDETWLQVEDAATRDAVHYAFVEWYVTLLQTSDVIAAQGYAADYILEMQAEENSAYEEKGRQLLANIVQ